MSQKMVLDYSLLNTQHHKVQIKGKWSNPWKRVASSLALRCSNYRKWSLQGALGNCRPTYMSSPNGQTVKCKDIPFTIHIFKPWGKF